MAKKEERFCGNCAWFYAEDTYGFGGCTHQFAVTRNCEYKCNVDKFVSREEMRHHLAVLTRLLRWTRDKEHLHPVSWEDIMKAIEFAIEYIKTFNKL